MLQLNSTTHTLNSSSSQDHRIMIFSSGAGGHHPIYIRHLIDYWCSQALPGKLFIVVSPQMLKRHSDILYRSLAEQNQIQFIAIADDECQDITAQTSPLVKARKEWKVICHYAKSLQANHCLITSIDHFQLILALRAKSPCDISGIYFRPTFHYNEFENYTPSWQDRVRQLRQKFILSLVLKNPKLKSLFCLDPFAVEFMRNWEQGTKLIHLPDPVRQCTKDEAQAQALRAKLGISKNKKVLLLFGALNARKGILQLLEAIRQLSDELCQNLCLLLVGCISPSDKSLIEVALKETSQLSSIQIIVQDKYVGEEEVQHYFEASDLVLAPYQRHVGMSGVLLLAASSQKPVLSSDYGLMGELTRCYELGLVVDSTNPRLIAEALIRFLSGSPYEFCNPAKMKQLAQENDATKFSATIFNQLSYG